MDIRVPDGWTLVTASTQAEVEERIPKALAKPGNIALHLHGLREAISLRAVPGLNKLPSVHLANGHSHAGIGWLIVSGGEHPLHPAWVRSLRDQCQQAGVPFCFLGWGTYGPEQVKSVRYTSVHSGIPMDQPASMFRVGKSRSGRLLDGQVWDQKPEGL